MKQIELFEIPLPDGNTRISHVGSGYARSLGVFSSEQDLEIGETKSGEPSLFAGAQMMLPVIKNGNIVLVAAMTPNDEHAWLHLTR